MYDKRIKIFVILIAIILLLCLLRLTQIQLLDSSYYRDKIAELKLQRRQLKTIRGKILDRKGKVLAVDEPKFQLCINYRLSRFADERVQKTELLEAARTNDPVRAKVKLQKELQAKLEDLQQIIDKCRHFGLERADIEKQIAKINSKIWNLRTFLAWWRNGPNPKILEKYNHKISSIPLSAAIADFEKRFPSKDRRLALTAQVDDIADMDKDGPILELKTDDDIFAAQLEFMDFDGIEVLAKSHRLYPYRSVAAQTIGWVGPPQEADKQLFAEEKLSSYLDDELCGREDGVEYVCETKLRGRRGEIVYDIDHQLISRTETQFGEDVQLSLDIELQQRIEQYLADCSLNPNCKAPIAAVVIDVGVPKREKGPLPSQGGGAVATGDILALVSMPVFDLNRIRYDYAALVLDPNEPLRNRAINKQYPPGSVIKPLILIAGLGSGKITPDEIISCPAQKAPTGWPSCWLYNRYRIGHSDKWENNARNAVKGSCNIYFSRLADRIDPLLLQQWLFKFGYGHKIPLAPALRESGIEHRDLRQAPGIISSGNPQRTIVPQDRRLFGIGQGNLRATPLQVANAMATIARGGLYKPPRLFMKIQNSKFKIQNSEGVAFGISTQTLEIIYDGMNAVVNEPGGTAYKEFVPVLTSFVEQGVKVYGKTGSTENPDNAWFAGFAEDDRDRSIAIAVVVEGGQHGSADAAPIARDIVGFCIEAGYIGRTQLTAQ